MDAATITLVAWDGQAWRPLLPCSGCGVDTAARLITVRRRPPAPSRWLAGPATSCTYLCRSASAALIAERRRGRGAYQMVPSPRPRRLCAARRADRPCRAR
jgi:hypothetical protein